MKIGVYRFGKKSGQQIECAYSGCKDNIRLKKGSVVKVAIGGVEHEIHMAGLSEPLIVDSPQTALAGADLSPAEILEIKWHRLDFVGHNQLLGDIELGLASHPNATLKSRGIVTSLSNPKLDKARIYAQPQLAATGAFYPALNDNEFYFQIYSRKANEVYLSDAPVRNQAVIETIPPLTSVYEFKEPVTFRPQYNTSLPPIDVIECRIGMATLRNVELEVNSIARTGDGTSRITMSMTNQSTFDDVEICVMCDSASNIIGTPRRQFVALDRKPKQVEVDVDISRASPPGTITISVILYKPFESRGSNNVLVDYEEIMSGVADDSLPML